MTTAKYWKQRQIIEREALLDLTIEESNKELIKMYRQTALRVVKELTDLYTEIEADEGAGNVLHSHLYQYQKYYEVLQNINKELTKLGTKEVKFMDAQMTKLYKENAKIVGKDLGIVTTTVDNNLVRQAVNSIWVSDGLNWSDRIWRNKALLRTELEMGLTDIISTGRSHKELSKELMKKCNSSYKNAERLVRTELCYVVNQSTLQVYERAGLTEYIFLTAMDERTCEICGELDGKTFSVSGAQPGVNLPPLHCNCRCAILGVVK